MMKFRAKVHNCVKKRVTGEDKNHKPSGCLVGINIGQQQKFTKKKKTIKLLYILLLQITYIHIISPRDAYSDFRLCRIAAVNDFVCRYIL